MGPLHFAPILLSPVLIMGYPTFSTYHPNSFDLFQLSEGYEYVRDFSFENAGFMRSVHKVRYCGDHLTGDFKVLEAEVDLPALTTCEPTVETFFPAGPGRIESQFLMAWHTEGGELFRATVKSEYRLTHTATLPYMQFRFITFDNDVSPDHINQTERLNVFRDIRKLWFPPEVRA